MAWVAGVEGCESGSAELAERAGHLLELRTCSACVLPGCRDDEADMGVEEVMGEFLGRRLEVFLTLVASRSGRREDMCVGGVLVTPGDAHQKPAQESDPEV
jgi:hypothetical protein